MTVPDPNQPEAPANQATPAELASVQRKNRRTLLLIVLICAGPLAFAWIITSLPERPGWLGSVSRGELVDPPMALADLGLRADVGESNERRWRLLLDARECAQESCQAATRNLRQIPILLGRDGRRVLPVWVLGNEGAFRPPVDVSGLPQVTVHTEHWPDRYRGGILVVDPLDNVMMYFRPDQVGKPLLTDIKKLLRFSKAG